MSDNLIIRISPRPSAVIRLFCFPYAGGSSAVFQRWPERIDKRVEIFCIELPGRGRNFGSVPYTRLTALIPQLSQQIIPLLDRPFAFFGHSNGALVAFELARALQRINHGPDVLIASAKKAPSLLEKKEKWHELPDNDLVARLREMGGTPEEFFHSKELQDLFLPTIRADFALGDTYQYTPSEKLRTRPVLLRGTDDIAMDKIDQQAWAKEFTQAAVTHEIQGDHFFIDNNQTALLQTLNAEMTSILVDAAAA